MSGDPCFEPVLRMPLPGKRRRIRVVELLATGSNGGAQEHVNNILSRIDRERYEVSLVSLTNGSAIRRLERTGLPVCVIEEPDDERAIQLIADHLAAVNADVVHAHMYRAEVIAAQAATRLAATGRRRPFVVSTVHSSRVRSDEDRTLVRRLTPHMDHLIAVSRAIVRKIEDEGRVGAPVSLIYNGVDLQRYDEQEACCTLRSEFDIPEGAPIVGVVARLEPEKGHPTLLEAWPRLLASVPDAHLLIVGEGSRREALELQAAALGLLGAPVAPGNEGAAVEGAALDPLALNPLAVMSVVASTTSTEADAQARLITPQTSQTAPLFAAEHEARPEHESPSARGRRVIFTGRRDDVPAVTAALDVAVLPSYREAQGLSILEAMALSRPVVASAVGGIPEMIEDGRSGLLVPPRDPEALAAAIAGLLLDHPYADMLARAGRELVHERFCVELMVRAVETIYDDSIAEERRIAG